MYHGMDDPWQCDEKICRAKVTEIQCIGFVNKLKYFFMQHETDMVDVDILDIHRKREREIWLLFVGNSELQKRVIFLHRYYASHYCILRS